MDTSKDFAIVGRAMFTIVASRPAMKDPSEITRTIIRSFEVIFVFEVASVIVSYPCDWFDRVHRIT